MGSQPSKDSPEWIDSQAAAANLTYLEVERLAIRFRQLDTKAKGFIDVSVMQLPEFQESPFAEDVFDFQRKQKVDFQQFLRMCAWWKHVDMQSKLQRIFSIFVADADHKGRLREADLVDIIEAVRPDDDEEEARESARTLMAAIDDKGQGFIDSNQFVRFAMTRLGTEALNSLLAIAIIPGDVRTPSAKSAAQEDSSSYETDDDEEEEEEGDEGGAEGEEGADAHREEMVRRLQKISMENVGMQKYDEAFVAARQALVGPTSAWEEHFSAVSAFAALLGADGEAAPAQLVGAAKRKGLLQLRATLQAESSWVTEEEHVTGETTSPVRTSGVLAWEVKRQQSHGQNADAARAAKQAVDRVAGSLATVIVLSRAAALQLDEISERTASFVADVSRIASAIGIEAPKVERSIELNREAVAWATMTVREVCAQAETMLKEMGAALSK